MCTLSEIIYLKSASNKVYHKQALSINTTIAIVREFNIVPIVILNNLNDFFIFPSNCEILSTSMNKKKRNK